MRLVDGKAVVEQIIDGMELEDVLCTTYQMRNIYEQMGDACFSVLDTMNYIQHHQIALWCGKKPGWHVLDVCCGRGLMLPLLRRYAANIGSYTGVDIEPRNAVWTRKRVTDNKPVDPATYYPFPVQYVEANVAEMSASLSRKYDILVYTSSIEHMHKEAGIASLHECRKVAADKSLLFLTCPNTPEDKSGYETQYAAHVYEWKRSELLAELAEAGFDVVAQYGLLINKTTLLREAEAVHLKGTIEWLTRFVPIEWLLPVFAPMFPEASKEIGIIAKAA